MLKASAPTGCCRTRRVQAICCVTGGVGTSCRSLGITPGPADFLGTAVDTCPCPGTCSGDIRKCPVLPVDSELLSSLLRRSLVAVPWVHGLGHQLCRSQAGSWAGASLISGAICIVGPALPQPMRPGGLQSQEGAGCGTRSSWHSRCWLEGAGCGTRSSLHSRCWLGPSSTPSAVGAAHPSVAQPSLGPKGALQAQSDRDWAIVPWAPLALLWEQLPLQGGQALPCCCAGFVTVRLMLVIGSFYHLSVSSQLLKPASARIYYLADKYKCKFILSPCSSERNENVSKIVKIK